MTNPKFRKQDSEKGESSKRFTYTTQRGGYISIIGTLLFLMLIEGGAIVLLIAIFVSDELIKLALFGIIGLFDVFVASGLLAPLWTSHRVDAKHLRLRYGFNFKADIPRSAIMGARPVREKVGMIPTVRYEATKQRVVAAFSEKGEVLLRLDQAYPLRVGLFSIKNADQILINVDDRDEFLGALDLPTVSDTSSELQNGMLASGNSKGSSKTGNSPENREPRDMLPCFHGRTQGPPLHPSPLPPLRTEDGFTVSTLAVRTENLTRRFGNLIAVDKLNLSIHRGEIYGFLGANGAGKTTTMKMLVGLLEPDAGRAEIGGYAMWENPLAAKAVLGYVGDRAMLYDRLTGREFLMFLAQMRGIPRQQAEGDIDRLLNMLELADRAQSQCATYSYGMKRKLALAAALLHHPSVLILDEPLNGLDPLSARRLKDLFAELAADGIAIFLSTHDLATAESLCHRVGIIARGRLLVEGSANELREIAAAPDLESIFLTLMAGQEEVLQG